MEQFDFSYTSSDSSSFKIPENDKGSSTKKDSKVETVGLPALQPADISQNVGFSPVVMPLSDHATGEIPTVRSREIPSSPPPAPRKYEDAATHLMNLRSALDERDFEKARQLLDHTNFFAADSNGTTAFHIICESGTPSMIRRALHLTRNPFDASKAPHPLVTQPNHKGQSALHLAQRNPSMAQVTKILLQEGAPINAVDNRGVTALDLACMRGDLQAVEYLLEQNASPHSQGPYMPPPIHLAAKYDHPMIVECLIKHGVDMDTRSAGMTPLQLACLSGSVEAAAALMKNGANLSVLNENGQGFLHLACLQNNTKMLQFLLEAGSNINFQDANGRTALSLAIERGNLNQVRYLLKNGAERQSSWPLCRTARPEIVSAMLEVSLSTKNEMLWSACRDHDCGLAQLLLRNGADIASTNSNGDNLLHMAIQTDDLELARLLVSYGINVNAKNALGVVPWTLCIANSSPLRLDFISLLKKSGATVRELPQKLTEDLVWQAVSTRNTEAIQDLLPWIKNVNSTDPAGTPLVHKVYQLGLPELTIQLLNRSANINATDSKNNTLLMLALQRGDESLAQQLINHGANVTLANKDGLTPVSLACNAEMTRIARLLVQKGAPLQRDKLSPAMLLKAAHTGDLDSLFWLLECGADINIPDKYGTTALHIVCGMGHLSLARQLIEKGARISPSDVFPSPLEAAITYANIDFFDWLLENRKDLGLDLNATNPQGNTPFAIACNANRFDMARKLADHGASVHTPCNSAPLTASAMHGNREFMIWLLDQNVDVNAGDHLHITALAAASMNGFSELSKLLIERGAEINEGKPFLATAIEKSDEDFILWLLDHGIKIDGKDFEGNTPLSNACKVGKWKVAEQLIKMGADIDDQGRTAPPPLISAVTAGKQDLVKLMLDSQANVNVVDSHGRTPLHHASMANDFELVSLLLQQGADQNIQDKDAYNALLTALHYSNSNIILSLLEKQGDCSQVGKDGDTVYGMVLTRNLQITESMLQEIIRQDLGKTSEILAAQELAHRFGVEGNSVIDNQNFALSGWYRQHSKASLELAVGKYYHSLLSGLDEKEGAWAQILNNLSPASLSAAKTLSEKQLFLILKNTQKAIQDSLSRDVSMLWNRIESGEPVGVLTGWPGHCIGLAFQGTKCARANKGLGCGDKPGVRIHTIKNNQALVEAITKTVGYTTSDYFLDGIEKELDLQDEKYIPQTLQKVGNCTVANSNGMELALLYLQLEPLIGSTAAQELANAIKKGRVEDSRVGTLKKYLDIHDKQTVAWQADLNLITAIHSKEKEDSTEDKICRTLIENWVRDQGIIVEMLPTKQF